MNKKLGENVKHSPVLSPGCRFRLSRLRDCRCAVWSGSQALHPLLNGLPKPGSRFIKQLLRSLYPCPPLCFNLQESHWSRLSHTALDTEGLYYRGSGADTVQKA